MELRPLGRDGPGLSPIGVGTWAWGDRLFWNFGHGYDDRTLRAAFSAAIESGVNWFDTAEIYGWGESERILGDCIRGSGREVIVATKFAPYPYRLSAWSVRRACEASLRRLGVGCVDLYQLHFPSTLLPTGVIMRALERLVKEGKVRHVGVSNFGVAGMERAREALSTIDISSNQVHYNILNRTPERNGVLEYCRRNRISLIAYSPLAQGILTGKYPAGARVEDLRRFRPVFRRSARLRAASVVDVLRAIGDRSGRTPAQVALVATIHDPAVIAIPGAKTAAQARENAGAMDVPLTGADRFAIAEACRAFETR